MHLPIENTRKHVDAECTFDIFSDAEGNRYLQIDTHKRLAGEPYKKTNSIRFTPEAIQKLKLILTNFNF